MAPSCNGGFPISHYRAGVCVHQIRPRQLNRALGTTESRNFRRRLASWCAEDGGSGGQFYGANRCNRPRRAHQLASAYDFSLAPASWCAGSAIKRPCEPVPVTHAPEGHRPDAKRRVHRSAARLPARPRPAPLVATNSSPGVCSVPTPPSHCISPPVCWRSITPPVAVAGSWECTLAASPGTR